MRRTLFALLIAVSMVSAGCLSGPSTAPGESPSQDESPSPVGTSPSPSESAHSPTGSAVSPTAEGTPVEYVIRGGQVPDEFASVTVTLQVIFVEDTADLGPCYPDVFSGPNKPTLTPLPTPAGTCHRMETVTIDLVDLEDNRTLGPFVAPASTRGHALIVTELTATYANGTTTEDVLGVGGDELIRSPERPKSPYGVTLGIQPTDHTQYSYYVNVTRFDPAS